MRRSGFTWIEALVVLAMVGIVAALFYPARSPFTYGDRHHPGCSSNLKQIALAVKQYTMDSGGKFPTLDIRANDKGLFSYVKDWNVFQCPQAPNDQPETTDYFTNARLAQIQVKSVIFPSKTILTGDGNDDSPTNYALSELPPAWMQDSQSPIRRHLDGAVYGFADGHVKWLKPDQISVQAPSSQVKATFALR